MRSPRILALAALSAAFATAGLAQVVVVEQGTAVRFRANAADPGLAQSWTAPEFDDSGWTPGAYGVGYEAGSGAEALIQSEVPDTTLSVYTRATFELSDASSVRNLLIGADYDDGWAAWINGIEVHRSREMPAGPLEWNADATLHESSNGATPTYTPDVDISGSALAALRDGANVLAVGVWNANAGSSDLVLVPRLVRDTPLELVRGPYLQLATPTSVVVRWRTTVATASRVLVGERPGALTREVRDPTLRTDHEVLLDGLEPGTRYCHAVGTDAVILAGDDEGHCFWTHPPVGGTRPLRFWVVGDSGTANADARAVRDAYLSFQDGVVTDAWLMLGDNAYEDGTDAEYQRAVFETYASVLRRVAVWPTYGNHDGRSADADSQSGVYFDVFTLPTQGEAGGLSTGTEAYYSFDVGNVHFVCLDSYESDRAVDGAMLSWLRDDLMDTLQDWVVAFWHHPAYTKGSHDSDTETRLIEMRERAVPILEDLGVDLVLTGHSHSYERTYLIDDHVGDSTTFGPQHLVDAGDGRVLGDGAYEKPGGLTPHAGAVHVVAGSSGKSDGPPDPHPAVLVGLGDLGSVVLDVRGLRLDARFLDDGGAVLDAFTLIKGCDAAPCTESRCGDGVDDDGDGTTDCADLDCVGVPECSESENCADGLDNDRDGWRDCADDDCASADGDADGTPDCEDCAPSAPDTWSPPTADVALEVGHELGDIVLAWTDGGPPTGAEPRHDVLSGSLLGLRDGGGFDGARCVADDVAGPSWRDLGAVAGAPGATWYLARAVNSCGSASVGVDGAGSARELPPTACE